MTLREFLDLKTDCEVTVYSHDRPIYHWFGDDDPRYKCKVLRFGISNKIEMWVDIDEDELTLNERRIICMQ